MTHPFERIPPQALEAEQATLSAMFLSRAASETVQEVLSADDFYQETHRHVFHAIASLSAREEPTDLLTVAAELRRHDRLDQIGGIPYLAILQDSSPTAAHALFHANLVRDAAVRRRLIDTFSQGIAQCYDGDASPAQIMDRTQEKLYALQTKGREDTMALVGPLITKRLMTLADAMETGEPVRGLLSGFPDLDRMTNGFHPSQLIFLAARPSVGKSALALLLALHVVETVQAPVALFSLEMSHTAVVDRLLAMESRIDSLRLSAADFRDADDSTDGEFARLLRVGGRLSKLPLYIDEDACPTVQTIRIRSRQIAARQGLAMGVVDYLGLVQSAGRAENRTQEVAAISRGLKAMARELSVPVLALCQLNRLSEHRGDKRPQLSDLRDSGAQEENGDVVLLLHAPHNEENDHAPAPEGMAPIECVVAKNRHGPRGTVHLLFNRRYVRFENPAPAWRDTPPAGEGDDPWER